MGGGGYKMRKSQFKTFCAQPQGRTIFFAPPFKDWKLFASALSMEGVDGGSPCRMSIIRNGYVTHSILRKPHVTLSNLKKPHVACH